MSRKLNTFSVSTSLKLGISPNSRQEWRGHLQNVMKPEDLVLPLMILQKMQVANDLFVHFQLNLSGSDKQSNILSGHTYSGPGD